uniref:Uncharacterized protein n=1 Tax=Cyprinodon variegatus TaxID=28743 RepID=A0A3Q2DC80_CYPVA
LNWFLFILNCCASLYYVTATVGADVSLKCSYNAWHHGPLPFCWGRESTSTFGCNNQVIKSDGTSVVSRLSWRYSLSGNLRGGDASLTIMQVQESDGGKYVCRVEIPGWFNDETTESILRIDHLLRMNISNHEACILIVTTITDPWSSAIRSWVKSTDATVVNLRPATTYNLRLFAVNSVGTSDASNVLTFTTKEAGKMIQWHECEVSSKVFFFTSCQNETVLNTFIPSVCKD